MKTGDVVQDAQGRSYQVGPLLGRGLWGKSYLIRQSDSATEYVLKCPLERSDFGDDAQPGAAILDACDEACVEQAQIISSGEHEFLQVLQSRQSEDGSPLLITTRHTTTLDRRISKGCSLQEVLATLISALQHLTKLKEPHGNLRPSNILLNERGEALLADLITPACRRVLGEGTRRGPSPRPPQAAPPPKPTHAMI